MKTNIKFIFIYFLLLLCASTPLMAGLDQSTDLTRGPQTDWANISPDGQTMVFTSNATGSNDIWTSDLEGNTQRLLNWPNSEEHQPDWSPDGKRIIFTSDHNSSDINIWSIAINGTDPKQLTADSTVNKGGRYSPDGQHIIFLSKRTGKKELWIMNADGSQQKAIGFQSVIVNSPSWSPAGNKIVYVGCKLPTSKDVVISPSTTSCNIYIITVDASETKQVTFGKFHDWNPDWEAGGIVFESNRNNDQALWLVNTDGTNLKQVNPNKNGGRHPKWDASGTAIVFSRNLTIFSSVSENIWQTDLFGNEQQLTKLDGFISEGDTNTDGKITCEDLYIVKASFGKREGQNGFNFRADINSDGIVNIRDLAFVSRKLPAGTSCP